MENKKIRLIDANVLKELVIETLEAVKSNPLMTREEMHLIVAKRVLCDMIDDAQTMNRWRNPKLEPPKADEVVFVKYNGDEYTDLTEIDENGNLRLYHTFVPVTEVEAWCPIFEPYEEAEDERNSGRS